MASDRKRAGLRARAFSIDSEYVAVVRNPNRLVARPISIDMSREDRVIEILQGRGVRTNSNVVTFAATKADILDARAILEGGRFSGGERPSGMNTSRLAFFIAANVTALRSDGGLSGKTQIDLMDSENVKSVSFNIDALGRAAARAVSPDAWLSNLEKVQDESRARMRERLQEHEIPKELLLKRERERQYERQQGRGR